MEAGVALSAQALVGPLVVDARAAVEAGVGSAVVGLLPAQFAEEPLRAAARETVLRALQHTTTMTD